MHRYWSGLRGKDLHLGKFANRCGSDEPDEFDTAARESASTTDAEEESGNGDSQPWVKEPQNGESGRKEDDGG